MSMFGSDGVVGSSFNSDVLDAQPTDETSRTKLIDEIKSRAKGCISSGNMPEAIKLYSKAAELTADTAGACAIIRANRSMCYSNMGNYALALDDAAAAIEKDPSYIKGYYRKATALSGLSDFSGAKQALQAGLTVKPEDKELTAQLAKVSSQEAAAAKKNTSNSSSSVAKTVPKAATTISTNAAKSNPAAAVKPKPKPAANVSDDTDAADDEDLGNVRGYKKTSDGRTTTFFNRELDETAKSLIGDIAPKKLDAPASIAVDAAPTTAGASAWNSAGTYEEKILSDWAIERLQQALSGISYSVDQLELAPQLQAVGTALGIESVHMQVTEASGVQGHAQVSSARGKRKYLADMSADLKWTLSVSRSDGRKFTIKGTVNVIDISADKEIEWSEIVVNHKPSSDSDGISNQQVSELVKHFVRVEKGPHCLYSATLSAVGVFCDDLRTK